MQASRIREKRERERTNTLNAITRATEAIISSFPENNSTSTQVNNIVVPVVGNLHLQNLINLMASTMAGLSEDDIQHITNAVFTSYAEI